MHQLALLGVGTMGTGIAETWLAKGFAVAVYNRTPARAAPLAAKGARVAATAREAAAGAELVLAIVADEEASRAVWLGPDGALAGAGPGTIVVESSTVPPDWVRELAGKAAAQGCAFLDAPVGGSKAAAASGALAFFIGGDAAAIARARPALEAVARQVNHLGPTSAGATWKLIHNMMLAVHIATAAEAIELAARAGFDAAQTTALIAAGPAGSGIVQFKMPRFRERHFDEPDFALRHMLKDARFAVALGDRLGMRLDVVRAAAASYQRAVEAGFGDLDFAGILAAIAA
jgi:3-hydroxyisobutyrate dehydrogenase